MKLFIRNEFPCSAQEIWDVFEDPDFEARLEEASDIKMTTESREQQGDIEVRKIRCESKKELPRVMAKALGSDRLTYHQVNKLDRKANELQWEVIPMAMSDKVTAKGTTTVEEKNGEVVRVIDGAIDVHIPLIGRQIEKVVVGEVQKSFERAADLARTMIAERQAKKQA